MGTEIDDRERESTQQEPEDERGEEVLRMTIAPGALDLIGSAARGERAPEGFTFYLDGDLASMAAQKRFLAGQGFELAQSDVYPVVHADDTERALKLLWEHRVDGWWNYREKLIAAEICTEDGFRSALHERVEAGRRTSE